MSGTEGELDQVDVDGEPPEFDLSPRTDTDDPAALAVRRRRNVGALALLALLAVAAAFILTQALGSATQYFYTADQAVAKRASLGAKRFRIEGMVIDEPARSSQGNQQLATFTISANDISVPVTYLGEDPPALFKKCEPVVLVGKWAGTRFSSDQIIVKHTEKYTDQHPGRLSQACPTGGS